jgi:hypothetical protein
MHALDTDGWYVGSYPATRRSTVARAEGSGGGPLLTQCRCIAILQAQMEQLGFGICSSYHQDSGRDPLCSMSISAF